MNLNDNLLTTKNYEEHLQQVVDLFNHLSEADTQDLSKFYHAQAWFKDPFNEVTGITAIEAIFQRMYQQVHAPRFEVRDQVLQDAQAFLVWDFHFGLKRKPAQLIRIHGSSHLRFAEDGRVIYHRDYWDVAEELYEKLPVLGSLMRFLKRQAHS